MNKRIVIVDEEVQNPLSYFGLGLGNEIFSVDGLKRLGPDILKETLKLESGDAAMLVGSRAFEMLREFYHFGIRSENYWDCSLLRRLGIEGGAFVKVYHEDDMPSKEDVEFFMSPQFCEKRQFPKFKYKIAKTCQEAYPALDYFYNLPVGTDIGFDYETSGKAMDAEFCITGAAFALAYSNLQCAVFISFQDIRKNNTPEEYEEMKKRFARILVKHQRGIWTFNLTYESSVSWREFGVELEMNDSSCFNTIDGHHSKNFSLKWTAQRLLGGGDVYRLPGMYEGPGIEPWDSEFDFLEETIGRMYYTDVYVKGKKKPVGKQLICNEYDFQISPYWKKICQRYPDYVDEFKQLVLENFGNPFLNMPSDILGKYCCLDAFYTVLIPIENKHRYSELCIETFLNNQRIYSRNSRAGLYTDDGYIEKYSKYSRQMMLWGILYMASYRCYLKIQKHQTKAAKIERYPVNTRVLLERNEFYQGVPGEIAKNVLAQNVDLNDIYDSGLDEGGLVFKYGQKFAAGLVGLVKEAMVETKFKGKIDSTVARKKKLLGAVAEKLVSFLGLDKIKINSKHIELEKLLYYKRAYKNLQNVWAQIPDMSNVPEVLKWGKQKMGIEELTELIMTNYYRCSSPVDNEELERELIEQFKLETNFLATIKRESNKLDGEKTYYARRGLNTPEDAFNHFGSHFHVYYENLNQKTGICLWPSQIPQEYPTEFWGLAMEHASNIMCDRMRDIWGSFDGESVLEDYFPENTKSQNLLMSEPWSEDDLKLPTFTLMRKLQLNILLYKKYRKVLTTYLQGLFSDGSKYVIETPQLIPTRDAVSETEVGAVKKVFTRYAVLSKTTKRSSSG